MIKTAVIGVGNIGKNHLRIYNELKHSKLVGFAELNKDLGKELSQKFNVPYYESYFDLIAEQKPDAISICVPTSFHYKITLDCLERKVHCLVEKPITKDLNQANVLLKFARKKNLHLHVGHIERHNPAVKKVKELIDSDLIGKVTSILARRVGGFPPQVKDVDIVSDLAIHDIDIVNYLLGDRPLEVKIHKQKNHIVTRADSAEIFLRYKKASAFIQANWITPVKVRKLNITGTEGYIELDYINQTIDYYKSNYKKLKDTTSEFTDYILYFLQSDKQEIVVERKEPLKEELQYFVESIRKKTTTDSRYAYDALKIALGEQ